MAYQSNNCGGTEVATGQFVWPAGDIGFFASCHLMLAVAPTTTGVLTITAETTADVYDLSNSQLTMTNEFVVLAPTSLVIRHTAVASPTLPFTYTVSAPPHALYATHAITASGTAKDNSVPRPPPPPMRRAMCMWLMGAITASKNLIARAIFSLSGGAMARPRSI
jgi:hypothetical protein